MKISIVVVLALVLIGCESSRQSARLTAEQAKTLAIRLANEKTDAIYHHKPFQDNSQQPRFEAEHWIWSDSQGFGSGDIQARVDLAADGSTNSVDIKLLDNKNPASRTQFP